jgi:hypothetical protein
MASIVEEFVKRGIKRENITPDMVKAVLEEPEELRARAIDVATIPRD